MTVKEFFENFWVRIHTESDAQEVKNLIDQYDPSYDTNAITFRGYFSGTHGYTNYKGVFDCLSYSVIHTERIESTPNIMRVMLSAPKNPQEFITHMLEHCYIHITQSSETKYLRDKCKKYGITISPRAARWDVGYYYLSGGYNDLRVVSSWCFSNPGMVLSVDQFQKIVSLIESKKSTIIDQIHISYDNKTTHCVVKADGKVVLRSKAVCTTGDKENYDQLVGAVIAMLNLIPKEKRAEFIQYIMNAYGYDPEFETTVNICYKGLKGGSYGK